MRLRQGEPYRLPECPCETCRKRSKDLGSCSQREFLEQWPEARVEDDGVLSICPAWISLSHRRDGGGCLYTRKGCGECLREFWTQEVE